MRLIVLFMPVAVASLAAFAPRPRLLAGLAGGLDVGRRLCLLAAGVGDVLARDVSYAVAEVCRSIMLGEFPEVLHKGETQ